ncbi:MAG: PEGA domain-containing protein [Kofleriaceae bacterium]
MKLRQLVTLTLVAVLGAQVAPPIEAAWANASLDLAKQKFDTAQADYAARSFNKAAEGFLEAYKLRPDIAELLYNAAAAYEEQAKAAADADAYDNAAKYYQEFVAAAPDDPSSATLSARIPTLTAEAASLRANPPAAGTPGTPSAAVAGLGAANLIKGVYVIESNPSAAEIYLDSEANGVFALTPWSGVITGEHTVIIKARGYRPKTQVLATTPNGLVVQSFDLAVVDSTGFLTVTSSPPGANVYIDDKSKGSVGPTPYAKAILPGKHTIYVSADGYDEFVTEIDVREGETPIIDAVLKGAPVGYLNMRGDGIEDSKVYIDGELACDPGPCRRALREGAHDVTVTRPGYKTFKKKVEINAKAETTIKVDLAEVPGRGDAIIAYVLSAAFAGGGVYLGMQANNLRDELDADIAAGAPPVDETDPRFTRGKIYAIAANAAYGIGAITFLTAVYYTFRDKGPPSRGAVDTKSLALTPTLGAGYAGLDMEVRW